MATLGELSRLIRSKNAGPFSLTFDVMFEDDATYRRVVDAKVLTKASFGALYGVPEEDMRAQLRTGVSVSVEASVLDRRRRARPSPLLPQGQGQKHALRQPDSRGRACRLPRTDRPAAPLPRP
jgi:Domain of unknown function (DUF4387)